MEILKVKDWVKSKSGKQFKTIMIGKPSGVIIKAQRISDYKLFDLNQCVQTRSVYIANNLKVIHVFINKFMSDNIHVELYVGVNGFQFHDKELDFEVEINNMEAMAEFMAAVVVTKLTEITK